MTGSLPSTPPPQLYGYTLLSCSPPFRGLPPPTPLLSNLVPPCPGQAAPPQTPLLSLHFPPSTPHSSFHSPSLLNQSLKMSILLLLPHRHNEHFTSLLLLNAFYVQWHCESDYYHTLKHDILFTPGPGVQGTPS